MTLENNKPFKVGLWVLFISLGWIIGIGLVLLLAVAAEALRMGGQWMVGLGMSAGVGFMQWLLLRKFSGFDKKWILLSILGFTIPFLFFESLAVILMIRPEVYVPVSAAVGSLLCGWLQYHYELRSISTKAKSWIVYNFVGWVLACAFVMSAPLLRNVHFPRVIGIVFAFAYLFSGGPIVGAITGSGLSRILKARNNGT